MIQDQETVDLEDEDDLGQHALPASARAAIQALGPLDKKQLMVAAKYWWRTFRLDARHGEARDLLQEALLRTLNGDRKWKEDRISIVKHLDAVMRSIAGHRAKKDRKDRLVEEAVSYLGPSHSPDPETQFGAKEELDNIRRLFENDPEGFAVIRCRADGMKASAIRAELDLDDKAWETVRKRIHRKFMQQNLGR